MSKPKLAVLVGLPGSGKSTHAKVVTNAMNDESMKLKPGEIRRKTLHISSDDIRDELFAEKRGKLETDEVIRVMHKRTREALLSGNNVIYDATNLTYKHRRNILNNVPKDVIKFSVLMATPFEVCLLNNKERDNTVPDAVMNKMYKRFNFPVIEEGFDSCIINNDLNHDKFIDDLFKLYGGKMLEALKGNTDLFNTSTDTEIEDYLFSSYANFDSKTASSVTKLPHDNPHHTFSVSRHIYHVWGYLSSLKYDSRLIRAYTPTDWDSLCVAGFMHDLGKGFTKKFEDREGNETRYAHYVGHENVSAYLAMIFCERINLLFDRPVFNTDKVTRLVQFHMIVKDTKAKKWKQLVDDQTMTELKILNEADQQAK